MPAPFIKQGYKDQYSSTTKVKCDVDRDGNIITDPTTQTAVGTKRVTINGANIANSLSDNTEVIQAFLDLVGASGVQDSLSNTVNVTWGVA